MANTKRDTIRYTMRDGNKIVKFGVTDRLEQRERENQAELGSDLKLRKEGPKVTRDSALDWESGKIEDYERRNGEKPPGNAQK